MEKNQVQEIRNYCLNCVNKPCSNKGCPLENDIPSFIHEGDTKKAFEILCNTTVLPAICGRICPHSKQCESKCIRGIKGKSVSIGKVESYIGDIAIKEKYAIPKELDENLSNKKVAIIGSGPAGLTCAAFLAKKGINVTIYEKNSSLGGLFIYGIPEFRLDRQIVKNTIKKILDLGIKVKIDKALGKDYSIKELTDQYDAIFVAIGANNPNITLEGNNVLSGNKLLEDINIISNDVKENESEIQNQGINIPDFKGKNVVISGGGNVAIDTARTLKRMDANVTVVYRRSEIEMPAEFKEIEDAKNEGIKFLYQTNILSVLDNSKQIECVKTELIKKEGEERLYPVNIENSNFILDADYIVLATGSKTNQDLLKNEGLAVNEKGYVLIDKDYKTSIEKVYAGGDLIGTKATVAWAARSGRNAAEKIIENLK